MATKGLLPLEKSMTATKRARTTMITTSAMLERGSSPLRERTEMKAAKALMRKAQVRSEPARPAHRPASW